MKINVGVFFGGRSVEHEISVISALQAMNALDKDKYSVIPVYISKEGKWYTGEALWEVSDYKDPEALLKKCAEVYMAPLFGDRKLYRRKKGLFGKDAAVSLDIAFPVLHGTNGEDGTIQGLLELIGIPYVGCDVLASANGMDKITMKMILCESGVPVIDYVWFTDRQWHADKEALTLKIEQNIGFPVIVKPANLGSSVGISCAEDQEKLGGAVEYAGQFASRILVEKMITGLREINCAVLGDYRANRTSVCEEPLRSGEILSYEDKYMGGGGKSAKGGKTGKVSQGMQSTVRRIPAELPAEVSDKIRGYASETFRVLSCNGVARVDFILNEKEDKIYVNEINTIPGSLAFYLWEATGLGFGKLMDELIDLGLKRDREGKLKTVSYSQNIFNMPGGGGLKNGKAGAKS